MITIHFVPLTTSNHVHISDHCKVWALWDALSWFVEKDQFFVLSISRIFSYIYYEWHRNINLSLLIVNQQNWTFTFMWKFIENYDVNESWIQKCHPHAWKSKSFHCVLLSLLTEPCCIGPYHSGLWLPSYNTAA